MGNPVGARTDTILMGLDWRQSKTVCSQGEGTQHELKPLIPTGPVKEIGGRKEESRSLCFSTDVALQPPGLSSERHEECGKCQELSAVDRLRSPASRTPTPDLILEAKEVMLALLSTTINSQCEQTILQCPYLASSEPSF